MDKYHMDGHKLFWHLDRVNEWINNKKIVPLHIDLGITTGCNLACKYCYGILQGRTGYGGSVSERVDMPREALLRLLKDTKELGIRSIAFIGEGENTLNPALYDALDYAKKIDLDVSLATNGVLIQKEKIDKMLSTLQWIRINISAANPKSYLTIHKLNAFDKVTENIKELVKIKKEESYKCTIGMQMVLIKENMEEVIPFAKLGSELGVDYVVIKACSDTSKKTLNSPDKEYLDMRNVFNEAEKYKKPGYDVIIKWEKLRNLGRKEYKICYGTQFIIAISGNGNVFPCGHWFNIQSEEFKMGNIIDTSLKKIIKSERYWQVQRKVQTINVNKDCETNCRQYYINQFLYDLKKNTPDHINFI